MHSDPSLQLNCKLFNSRSLAMVISVYNLIIDKLVDFAQLPGHKYVKSSINSWFDAECHLAKNRLCQQFSRCALADSHGFPVFIVKL